jgi:hypothetical protein
MNTLINSDALPLTICSEIFSADSTLPNDGEQVVIIRADGWWDKGSWSKRFGWRGQTSSQPVAFWMRVFVPNVQSPPTGGKEA